jgi:hypothetical protein
MLVGVEGFEPPTSCSQSRRATGLRYTPKTIFSLVPRGGIEPPRGCPRQILSLVRLPVPPSRRAQSETANNKASD